MALECHGRAQLPRPRVQAGIRYGSRLIGVLCITEDVLDGTLGAILHPQPGRADDLQLIDYSLIDHASMRMHRHAPFVLILTELLILFFGGHE